MTAWFASIGNALRGAFLAPQFFWFLLLIPVVILLYLLKLRRTHIVISSTMLWMKSLRDLTANAPFQRLRKNLLLFLQILILLFTVFALARPFVRAESLSGGHFALAIDHSASMQTREGEGTRLDQAKEEALDLVDAMKGGDQFMVISFAESAEVLCELTDDKFRLRSAIRSVEPTDTRTNIRDVFMIARSLAPDNPDIPSVVADLELILFSDGNLSDIESLGARAANMTYRKIGSSTNNAGIVGFSVRNPEEGQTMQQTFVLVHNEHTEALNTTLSLYFEDSLITVEEISVPAGEDKEVLFEHGDFGDGVLSVGLDYEDDLAIDNKAWLSMQTPSFVRTLLVTPPDSTSGYYLKRALALEPRVELSAVSPTDYIVSNNYDLTIFDGFAPDERPGGSLIFFDAVPAFAEVNVVGDLANPPVLAVESDHPAMRFLNPGNIGITTAMQLDAPEGSLALLSTEGGPLIVDVSQGGQQILLVAFSVSDSNWPLRLSFPLFLQNLVSWTPRAALDYAKSVATGTSISLMPQPDLEEATIIDPEGNESGVRLDPLRPVYFGATDAAGVYTIKRGDSSSLVAVNLLDRLESSISPTPVISVGRGEIVAQPGPIRQTRELWRWLIWAAVGILTLEWWIYSRRAWL